MFGAALLYFIEFFCLAQAALQKLCHSLLGNDVRWAAGCHNRLRQPKGSFSSADDGTRLLWHKRQIKVIRSGNVSLASRPFSCSLEVGELITRAPSPSAKRLPARDSYAYEAREAFNSRKCQKSAPQLFLWDWVCAPCVNHGLELCP